MDDIADRCIAIIAKSKNPPLEGVTLDSSFDELGMDSLDKINASFAVEDTFDIQIPDESMNSLRTVRDMVNGVTLLLNKPAETIAVEESK
ncbi:acyl carrier protein [Granulicella arctica]|uniref:Acyl carrier protein n=1 Tax=Granulicella arctica TaxID=940613 RepID=A0A7Y9PDQ2_9BACT|nr:acyl carrier protein [Granulicella arctica]NYF78031.1 acyl carrier protein [Granulicella arctica]